MSWVRAHTNIALIKYWGKKDIEYKIPYNSSLSLTLDSLYTDTKVEYQKDLDKDLLFIDDKQIQGKEYNRVVEFMNYVRKTYGISEYAVISSYNHVPKAAGLASSASAFAALAKASTLSLDLEDEELSRLARIGSGSASRSIFKDFVIWEKGTDHSSSFAHEINMEPWNDFRMIVCLVNKQEKPFLSSEAMDETVQNSVYYEGWVKQSAIDIEKMQEYIKAHDIYNVGKLAQENALRMHASLMSVGKWYFEPETIEVINKIRELQKEIPVYFTMDAGPNVKLITTQEHIPILEKELAGYPLLVCKQGPGVMVYDN